MGCASHTSDPDGSRSSERSQGLVRAGDRGNALGLVHEPEEAPWSP